MNGVTALLAGHASTPRTAADAVLRASGTERSSVKLAQRPFSAPQLAPFRFFPALRQHGEILAVPRQRYAGLMLNRFIFI